MASASSSIPDITLLLQDLLSPSSVLLPSTTPSLIAYHLAHCGFDSNSHSNAEESLLPTLIGALCTSPALWRGQAQRAPGGGGWPVLDYKRALEVYHALVQGWLYRAQVLSTAYGTGWRARRRFSGFLEGYLAGLGPSDSDSEGEVVAQEEIHPTIRLLVTTAPLAALQAIKFQRDKLYVGGRALIGRAEGEVLCAWRMWVREEERDRRAGQGGGEGLGGSAIKIKGEWSAKTRRAGDEGGGGGGGGMFGDNDPIELPAWLASQVLPQFSVDALAEGPVAQLLHLLSLSHSRVFSSGHLFSTLSSSLILTPTSKLHWTVPSPSHDLLTALSTSPLFLSLGPLSRALGRLIEAAGARAQKAPADPSTLVAVRNFGTTLERTVGRVQRDWGNCAWSDLTSEQDLDEPTRGRKEPWTMLKSLLFSITLIDSSLLVIVSPSRAGAPPTDLQLELAKQALRILSKTYVITLQFGTEGFGAWKGAWVGLVEVVGQDSPRGVERLMVDLEPQGMDEAEAKTVRRSEVTFYLNVAEQLMKGLGEDYVEEKVLRCCYPYLESTLHRETFESAHSVLLAIFATQKRCCTSLAPWYTRLLLRAHPSLMSPSQLRLAFTTMIRCISATDDALAWYCILQLIQAIRSLPTSAASPPTPTTSAALPQPASPTIAESATGQRDFDEEASSTRLDESSLLSPLEQRALTLPRGALLLTLIDQTTSVNLILLRKLLDEIWAFVREEAEGVGVSKEGEETPKEALVKVVFGTLGEGLDATKRSEGVRYWLEHREELADP